MAIELDGLLGIVSDGNITTGNFYFGNGVYLTGINSVSSYTDANVIALLASGNVAVANISTINSATVAAVNLTVTGNATANSIYSNNYFYANGTPFTGTGVVIGDQQIAGTGTTTYTLNQAATTTSVLVNINGVTQAPTTAYSVSGNTITFSSTVNNASTIGVRYFAASGGNSMIYGDANVAAFMPTYTGSLSQAVGIPKSTVQNSTATVLTITKEVTTFSAPQTVVATLPMIDSSTIGVQYTIVDTWGGIRGLNPINITVGDPGNETIDGITAIQLTQSYGAIVLICVSATEWIVISN